MGSSSDGRPSGVPARVFPQRTIGDSALSRLLVFSPLISSLPIFGVRPRAYQPHAEHDSGCVGVIQHRAAL